MTRRSPAGSEGQGHGHRLQTGNQGNTTRLPSPRSKTPSDWSRQAEVTALARSIQLKRDICKLGLHDASQFIRLHIMNLKVKSIWEPNS